jgi:hypothetical protein
MNVDSGTPYPLLQTTGFECRYADSELFACPLREIIEGRTVVPTGRSAPSPSPCIQTQRLLNNNDEGERRLMQPFRKLGIPLHVRVRWDLWCAQLFKRYTWLKNYSSSTSLRSVCDRRAADLPAPISLPSAAARSASSDDYGAAKVDFGKCSRFLRQVECFSPPAAASPRR